MKRVFSIIGISAKSDVIKVMCCKINRFAYIVSRIPLSKRTLSDLLRVVIELKRQAERGQTVSNLWKVSSISGAHQICLFKWGIFSIYLELGWTFDQLKLIWLNTFLCPGKRIKYGGIEFDLSWIMKHFHNSWAVDVSTYALGKA